MFSCYRLQQIPYTLKCCQLIQQCLLAVECRIFGDNSVVIFHKLHSGIWQNLLRKNRGPADDVKDIYTSNQSLLVNRVVHKWLTILTPCFYPLLNVVSKLTSIINLFYSSRVTVFHACDSFLLSWHMACYQPCNNNNNNNNNNNITVPVIYVGKKHIFIYSTIHLFVKDWQHDNNRKKTKIIISKNK